MFTGKAIYHDHTAMNDPDRVHVVGTIIGMVLTLAIMLLLNVFPDKIGIIRSPMDPASFRPLLAPEFREYMPWLNLCWGLTLTLCAINLTSGRWNIYSRWAEIGLNVLGAYILLRMVLGGPLLMYPGLTIVAKLGLLVALCAIGVETIVKLVRLLAGMQTPVPPEQPRRSPDR